MQGEPITSPAAHTSLGGYDPLFLSSWLWSKISISGSKGAIALSSSSLRGFHLDENRGFLSLELGCGNGSVLRVLQKAGPEAVVVGLELWFDGLGDTPIGDPMLLLFKATFATARSAKSLTSSACSTFWSTYGKSMETLDSLLKSADTWRKKLCVNSSSASIFVGLL